MSLTIAIIIEAILIMMLFLVGWYRDHQTSKKLALFSYITANEKKLRNVNILNYSTSALSWLIPGVGQIRAVKVAFSVGKFFLVKSHKNSINNRTKDLNSDLNKLREDCKTAELATEIFAYSVLLWSIYTIAYIIFELFF